jgi:hypothetical protein
VPEHAAFAQSAEHRRAAANLKTDEPKHLFSLDFPSRRAAWEAARVMQAEPLFRGGKAPETTVGFLWRFLFRLGWSELEPWP